MTNHTKTILPLLLLALLFAAGCDGDITGNGEDDLLVGTWEATEYVVTSQADPNDSVDLIAENFIRDWTMTFGAEGSWSMTVTLRDPDSGEEFTTSGEGTYRFENGQLTVDAGSGFEPPEGELSVSGSTLVLEDSVDQAWDFDGDGDDDPGHIRLMFRKL